MSNYISRERRELYYIRSSMRYSIALLLLVSLFALSCKHKKKRVDLAGDQPVTVSDFIDFFQPLKLPFQFSDTSFKKPRKKDDSLQISYTVFSAIVPDTVLFKAY